MGFRTVMIHRRCKLDLKMNYLTIRTPEDEVKVLIDEIRVLILEHTAISMTAALLAELVQKKVKVIFCDDRHQPLAEAVPYAGCHDSSGRLRSQLCWDEQCKTEVWAHIVREKISNQAIVLEAFHSAAADQLRRYSEEVVAKDETNRESFAAKVYFNSLFGNDFYRDDPIPINAALNFGYAVVLATVNREISAQGYLNQLGIFHNNQFNHFNLGCDFMEPFRPCIDFLVREEDFSCFGTEQKRLLLNFLQQPVEIAGYRRALADAIGVYVKSVLSAVNEQHAEEIAFIDLADCIRTYRSEKKK